jgi:hypothetical protein
MFVLIAIIISANSSVAVFSQEFSSQASCQAAKQVFDASHTLYSGSASMCVAK